MRHDFLDRYSRIDSPVHRLSAGVKCLAALVLLLAVILLPAARTAWFGGLAVFLAVVAALSRVPLRFLALRLLMLEPFALGVALLALFQHEGWKAFVLLMVRSTLSLSVLILLSNTTPFAELLRVLKLIRVPALIVTCLALMYRYVFILIDETERMHRARACRTFVKHRRQAWRTASEVIGQLFVRSTTRAERIYAAMCARGWR